MADSFTRIVSKKDASKMCKWYQVEINLIPLIIRHPIIIVTEKCSFVLTNGTKK